MVCHSSPPPPDTSSTTFSHCTAESIREKETEAALLQERVAELAARCSELETASAEVSRLEAQVAESRRAAESLAQEREGLVEGADEREGMLRLSLEREWRERLGIKDGEVAAAKERSTELEAALAKAEGDTSAVRAALETERDMRRKEDGRTRDDMQAFSAVRVDLEGERRRRTEAELALRQANARLDAAEAQLRHAAQETAQAEEQRRSAALQGDLLGKQQRAAVEEQLANAHSLLDQRNEEALRAHQRHAALAAQREAEEEEAAATVAAARGELEAVRAAGGEASAKLAKRDAEAAVLRESVRQLKEEQRIREEALDVFYKESQQRDRFVDLEERVETLQTQLSEGAQGWAAEKAELSTALDAARSGAEARESTVKDLERRLKDAKASVRAMEASPVGSARRSLTAAPGAGGAQRPPSSPVIEHATIVMERQGAVTRSTSREAGAGPQATLQQQLKQRVTKMTVLMGLIVLLVVLGFYNSVRSHCTC